MARNISLTLDDRGVAEVSSLRITSAATAAGNVIVTLDGVNTSVAVAGTDTAVAVADKIRAAAFAGWTTGGTAGTDTVTFTSNTDGSRVDAVYSPEGTGAAGTMSTTTQGVDKGNPVNAYKVALSVALDFEKRIASGETIAKVDSTVPDPALRTYEEGFTPSERFVFDITDLDPDKGVYKFTLI